MNPAQLVNLLGLLADLRGQVTELLAENEALRQAHAQVEKAPCPQG